MRILTMTELVKASSLSRTTIWREQRKGRFPKSIKLSKNRVGVPEDQYLIWLETKRQGTIYPPPSNGYKGGRHE
jgi:predicted DNA-binding transcriptional regulator AlpA